jgi:hypothetical protein
VREDARFDNQREFTRVPVEVQAELYIEGNVIFHGKLDNLSFNGLLVRCDAMVPEQTLSAVLLHLNDGQGGPNIEARGLVVRHNPHTIAVQFIELVGQESAHHLRNLLLYNSGAQADHVEGEFDSHVGLRTKS